jgi:hypothetical protein
MKKIEYSYLRRGLVRVEGVGKQGIRTENNEYRKYIKETMWMDIDKVKNELEKIVGKQGAREWRTTLCVRSRGDIRGEG